MTRLFDPGLPVVKPAQRRSFLAVLPYWREMMGKGSSVTHEMTTALRLLGFPTALELIGRALEFEEAGMRADGIRDVDWLIALNEEEGAGVAEAVHRRALGISTEHLDDAARAARLAEAVNAWPSPSYAELLEQVRLGKEQWDAVAALLGADGDCVDSVLAAARRVAGGA